LVVGVVLDLVLAETLCVAGVHVLGVPAPSAVDAEHFYAPVLAFEASRGKPVAVNHVQFLNGLHALGVKVVEEFLAVSKGHSLDKDAGEMLSVAVVDQFLERFSGFHAGYSLRVERESPSAKRPPDAVRQGELLGERFCA
jgi:hypothetical protein